MSEGYRDNKILFQKCHEALVKHTADVQFSFENGDGAVKIPANKAALAASSPVFNAMFNGALKEKGDVKITDASPEAFQEFLQLFYDPQVKLTMDNIAGVLKLVDKYDIEDGLPVCSGFLMDNAKIDDIFLALNLAIQYNLGDLKTFCEQKIVQNHQTVFDMINFDGGRLRVASDNRLTDIELEVIFPYMFSVLKNVTSNLTKKIKSAVLPITLSAQDIESDSIKRIETIQFSINKDMLLDEINCSNVYNKRGSITFHANHTFQVSIDEKPNFNGRDTQTILTRDIVIQYDSIKRNRIEMKKPLLIIENYIYTITFRTDNIFSGFCTKRATIPDTPVELAPGVYISFPQENHKHIHSLVSQLHFKFP